MTGPIPAAPTSPAGPTAPVSPAIPPAPPISAPPVGGGPAASGSKYTKFAQWSSYATIVAAVGYLCCGCGGAFMFDYVGVIVAGIVGTFGLGATLATGLCWWLAKQEGDDEAKKWLLVAVIAFGFSVVTLITLIAVATAKVAGIGA